jgi:hypothetical protein
MADNEKVERKIQWYNEHHAMLSIRNVFNWKKIELELRDAGGVVCAHCGVKVGDDHAASCLSHQTQIVVLKRVTSHSEKQ